MNRSSLARLFPTVLLAFAWPAAAIDSAFTYQGHLTDQGTPASGAYDLRFSLQDTSGAAIGTALVLDDVNVTGGVFTVSLDFGDAAFNGDDRFLAIAVRRGNQTGGFTELLPRTAIAPTPYAQVSAAAEIAATVAAGSIGTAQINNTQVQQRITGTCPAGQSIRVIAPTGTVTCEADDDTGVTSITNGGGITGSIAGRALTLGSDATVQRRSAANPLTCPEGQYLRAVAANGAATCVAEFSGWALGGNAGTDPENHFIGTTDAQPLVLRVRNTPVARYEASDILFWGQPTTANVILGSHANVVDPGVRGATISGGGLPAGDSDPHLLDENPNRVTDHFGTVGGGLGNQAGNVDDNPSNTWFSTVSGGLVNTASGSHSTVGGGYANTASGHQGTVGGGTTNTASGTGSAVNGGISNTASGTNSAVGGGYMNTASGANSTVSGGYLNCAGGFYSWAGGRNAKIRQGIITSSGLGGCNGVALGSALGDEGTFVWADTSVTDFVSTGSNQFLIRASGGMAVGSNDPAGNQLRVAGNTLIDGNIALDLPTNSYNVISFRGAGSTRATITRFTDDTFTMRSEGTIQLRSGGNNTRLHIATDGSIGLRMGSNGPAAGRSLQVGTSTTNGNGAHLLNGGAWVNGSSRNFKHAFEAIDTRAVLDALLDLPITRWRYHGEDAVQHLGPVAEEFRAAFGLGHDEKYIGTVDADGVALAAIQGLNAKLEAENTELRQRDAQRAADIAGLREELTALRALLTQESR